MPVVVPLCSSESGPFTQRRRRLRRRRRMPSLARMAPDPDAGPSAQIAAHTVRNSNYCELGFVNDPGGCLAETNADEKPDLHVGREVYGS